MTALPTLRRALARALARGAVLGLALGAAAPLAPAAAQQPTAAGTAPAGTARRAPRILSLADALQLGERTSEAVRVAEAGAQRARGQFVQARSQILPQLNATGAYQKQLQNQFQAIQNANPPAPVTPDTPQALCAPQIPATATPEERAAALARASTCGGGGDALGGAFRAFASPNNLILGVTGSQVLFAGGRVVAGLRASQAGERSAAIGVTAARAQVRLDVAQAYYDAALTDRLVAIAESSLVQTERTYRQAALTRQVGNASEFELLRARVTRDNQRPVLIQARTSRDVAYVRLRQLLDLPLDEPLALTTQLPAPGTAAEPLRAADAAAAPGAGQVRPQPRAATGGTGAGAPLARPAAATATTFTTVDFDAAEVLADDPTVAAAVDSVVATADTSAGDRATARQTRENVVAQRNLLRAARAQRLPAVQLSTNYQRFAYPAGTGIRFPSAFDQFFPNWTVTLGVSVPILTGGRIRGDELVAQANLREAEQTARQVEELAALDARLSVSQLAQAEAAWRASAGTAEQAVRAYDIAEVRFREGIATQVELADARLLLLQAQTNAATAARDREVARLRLALLRDLPLTQTNGAAAQATQRPAGAGGTGTQQDGQQQPPRAGQGGQPGGQPGGQQGAGGAGATGGAFGPGGSP